MTEYVFETAEEALKWAVEVLRRRRLPKTASFWREIEAEAEFVSEMWQGVRNMRIPQSAEERLGLALKVMQGLDAVAGGEILKLWVWGDWADEGRLRAALAMQEKLRRDGVRVRISYRYSYEQLGRLMGCDRKTAWRRVQEGLGVLGEKLVELKVVAPVEAGEQVHDNFKKMVYFYDFK